jgi:hypothetical protein
MVSGTLRLHGVVFSRFNGPGCTNDAGLAPDASSTVIEGFNGASCWRDDDCAVARPCDIAIAIMTSKTVVMDVVLIP